MCFTCTILTNNHIEIAAKLEFCFWKDRKVFNRYLLYHFFFPKKNLAVFFSC